MAAALRQGRAGKPGRMADERPSIREGGELAGSRTRKTSSSSSSPTILSRGSTLEASPARMQLWWGIDYEDWRSRSCRKLMRSWRGQFSDKLSRSSCYVEDLAGQRPCFVQANLGLKEYGAGSQAEFTGFKHPKDLILFNESQYEDDDVSITSSNSEESGESSSLNATAARDEFLNHSTRLVMVDECVYVTEERDTSLSLRVAVSLSQRGQDRNRMEEKGMELKEAGTIASMKEDKAGQVEQEWSSPGLQSFRSLGNREDDVSIPADCVVPPDHHLAAESVVVKQDGAAAMSGHKRPPLALSHIWHKAHGRAHGQEEAIRVNKENLNNNDQECAIPVDITLTPKDGVLSDRHGGVARRLFVSMADSESNDCARDAELKNRRRSEDSIPMDVEIFVGSSSFASIPSMGANEDLARTRTVRDKGRRKQGEGGGFMRSSSSPSGISFLDEIKSFLDRYKTQEEEEGGGRSNLYSSQDSLRYFPAALVAEASTPAEEEDVELDVDAKIVRAQRSLSLSSFLPSSPHLRPSSSSFISCTSPSHLLESPSSGAEPLVRSWRPFPSQRTNAIDVSEQVWPKSMQKATVSPPPQPEMPADSLILSAAKHRAAGPNLPRAPRSPASSSAWSTPRHHTRGPRTAAPSWLEEQKLRGIAAPAPSPAHAAAAAGGMIRV